MKLSLPQPWYYTVDELAKDWSVHPDRVRYYMDAGLMVPAAAIPRSRVANPVPGASPLVVIMLDQYSSLAWDAKGDPAALVSGVLRCFQTNGIGYSSFELTLDAAVEIRRSELVVCLDQREVLEETPRPQSINPVERRTLLQLIAVMASKGYAMDLVNHYADAQMLCKDAELCGIELSVETIAKKLIAAREHLPANV